MNRYRAAILSLLISAPLLANPFGVGRIFVPIAPGVVTGANQSRWSTTLSVFNGSNSDARIYCTAAVITSCPLLPAGKLTVVSDPPAGAIHDFWLILASDNPILRPAFEKFSFQLRSTDSATASLNAGTELPLLHLSDFRVGPVVIPDVPVNHHSRLRLRVYSAGNQPVTVKTVDNSSGELLATTVLHLSGAANDGPFTLPIGYAESPLDAGAGDSLRVEMDGAEAAVWGFVSVTDNASEQFTIATPGAAEYLPVSTAKQ